MDTNQITYLKEKIAKSVGDLEVNEGLCKINKIFKQVISLYSTHLYYANGNILVETLDMLDNLGGYLLDLTTEMLKNNNYGENVEESVKNDLRLIGQIIHLECARHSSLCILNPVSIKADRVARMLNIQVV